MMVQILLGQTHNLKNRSANWVKVKQKMETSPGTGKAFWDGE